MSYLQTVVPNRDPYLVAHLAICLQVKWRNGRPQTTYARIWYGAPVKIIDLSDILKACGYWWYESDLQ